MHLLIALLEKCRPYVQVSNVMVYIRKEKIGSKKRCPFDRRGQRIDSVGSTVHYEVIKIRAVDRILKSLIKSDLKSWIKSDLSDFFNR